MPTDCRLTVQPPPESVWTALKQLGELAELKATEMSMAAETSTEATAELPAELALLEVATDLVAECLRNSATRAEHLRLTRVALQLSLLRDRLAC